MFFTALWLPAEMVFSVVCPLYTKQGFLVKNATGGKRAGGGILAALGKNMLRLSNYFVNRFAPDAKLPECTAASHLWPLSLPSPSN